MTRSLVDRILRREDIAKGALRRWTLLRLPGGRALYLHHFRCPDARSLHDHPKRFVTIGIRGGYVEEVETVRLMDVGSGKPLRTLRRERRQYRAPWIRTFPARHAHRVRPSRRGCWTLAWVGPKLREWGFLHNDEWIPWQRFREVYDERRCP